TAGSFVLATLILYAAGWDRLWKGVPLMLGFAGLLYVLRLRIADTKRVEALRSAVWVPCYFGALLLVSRLGGNDGMHVIPAPVDSCFAIGVGAVGYFWAVDASAAYLRRYPAPLTASGYQKRPDETAPVLTP